MPNSSRYGITNDDLRRLAKIVQIGGPGLSQRVSGTDGTQTIVEAEYWAEAQISDYVVTPLQPVALIGSSTVPNPVTTLNFPLEFIQAIQYYALSRILASEFFENQPNASQSALWCEQQAELLITRLRSRPTTKVGAGRRRNPNPFVPPHIAPKERLDQQQGLGQ